MKNLMIFVDPRKDFNREHKTLAKIQIDYSLRMGWAVEDIMLVTNFDYEYMGVKAFKVGDDCYYSLYNRATKVPVINRLFEMGALDDQVWFHDFDAFQLEQFPAIDRRFAINDCGFKNKWNAGSFFFRDAYRIFKQIETCMFERGIDEENALTYMIDNGFTDYVLLDIAYCINIYHFDENCRKAKKPIMVVHFHPAKEHHYRLFEDLLPDSLKDVLEKYGNKFVRRAVVSV